MHIINFLKLNFTPCKAEQLLRGIELQEKEEENDEKDVEKLFRKSPRKKGVYWLITIF